MVIQNALLYGEDGFYPGELAVGDGLIAESTADGEDVDARGGYLIPGLIDLHFHGCVGADFSTATVEEMNRMARYQAAQGVTAICPATMTLPEEALTRACEAMAGCGCPDGAALVGINLEGPFLSAQRLGAQNPRFLQNPDVALFRRLQEAAGGLVKLLAVAPELPGGIELIRALHGEVRCSVAHSNAGYGTASEAFREGACQVAHLFNALPPLSHREPGVVGAAWEHPHVSAELICDGVHLHPATVRLALRLFGPERVLFVSDSMEATGLGDGEYELGGLPVVVQGKTARLREGGTIAGSATSLLGCLQTAVREMGIPLHTAVGCASVNPAKALGLYPHRGSLQPGAAADLVLLDREYNLQGVFLRGRRIATATGPMFP